MRMPRSLLNAGRAGLGRLRGLGTLWRVALAAGLLWAVLVLAYAIGFLAIAADNQSRGTVFLDAMFLVVALVLPLILIGLAAWLADELARQRALLGALAEVVGPLITSLQTTSATLREHGPASPQDIHRAVQGALTGARGPDVTPTLERILAHLTQTRAALEAMAGPPQPAPPAAPSPPPERRPAVARRPPPEAANQPDLPLLPEAEPAGPPDWPDLIRALDFPRDADDRDGFRALKAALRHHSLAQMLQAAEDVLDLLSQEGVFMDDLPVAPPEPADWRRFIAGARGAEVAGVGGIRDEAALKVARDLMKSDPIFRDTALFFQRRFDAVLQDFAREADDEMLRAIADTRSGRAFMLLARLSGSFD